MTQKNKLQNPLTFRVNVDPGAKCEKSEAKYATIHFSFFAFRECFRTLREKCIADLSEIILNKNYI